MIGQRLSNAGRGSKKIALSRHGIAAGLLCPLAQHRGEVGLMRAAFGLCVVDAGNVREHGARSFTGHKGAQGAGHSEAVNARAAVVAPNWQNTQTNTAAVRPSCDQAPGDACQLMKATIPQPTQRLAAVAAVSAAIIRPARRALAGSSDQSASRF